MIEIRRIHVRNFRSFADAELAPLGAGQGITAINGANGVGKSSIATHALLWALYGVTPDGVPVRALRKHDTEEDVSVEVTFTHDGQEVTVTRALRGKRDTTTATITVDGVEQTNVSARTATAWVTQRLQVNAEAFTTAFVVRQKELDSLVRARPAERRAVVERLAGIDRMSEALQKAREEARTRKTAADAIPVTITSADARAALQSAEDDLHVAETEHAAALTADTEIQAVSIEATQAYEDLASQYERREELRRILQEAQAEHARAKQEHQRVLTAAAGAEQLPDLQAAAADLRKQQEDIQRATQVLALARQEHTQLTEKYAALSARLQSRRTDRVDAETALAHAAARMQELATDDPRTMEKETAVREHQAREALGAAIAEKTRLQRALTMLDTPPATEHPNSPDEVSMGHDSATHACPTCQQTVTDWQGLRELLTHQQEEATTRVNKAQQSVDQAVSEHQAASAAVRDLDAAEAALDRAGENVERARTAEAETEAEAAAVAEELSQAQERVEKHSAALHACSDDELAERQTQVQTALRRAENAAEAAEQLPATQAAVTVAEEAVAQAQAQAQQCPQVTAEEVAVARAEAEQASREHTSQQRAVVQAEAKVQIAVSQVEAKACEVEAAEEAEAAKASALQAAEEAAAVAAALEEFRRDRIARLAPELSEAASDLLQVMTEGRYSTVELDEDFTPIVTEAASGDQRPVAWLSGGEESSVALALRLAIGEVVTGQKVGLLVLDEVLTAQDASRRAATMSAIRSIPHRQVLVINHVSESTDMVDLVAVVRQTPEGNVEVIHEAPDAPLEGAGVSGIDQETEEQAATVLVR